MTLPKHVQDAIMVCVRAADNEAESMRELARHGGGDELETDKFFGGAQRIDDAIETVVSYLETNGGNR